MYNLLQGNEKRQLRLAELLIHAGDWITVNELAQELDCSERILKYDLKEFDEIFSDFTIETSHHGVRLIFADNKGLKNIYHNIFNSSTAFKLLEKIFFDETYSVNELADILYVSPSTLYRLIHQINQTIAKNGFQIETNPCRVVGAEDKIRYFYYQFFFEKYTIMTWPYGRINHDMIIDLLYFFMDLTKFRADFAYYDVARLTIFVNLYRYNNEHYITTKKSNINLDGVLSRLDDSQEYVKYFEKRYKLKINEEFIIQISNPFIKEGFVFNHEQLLKQIEKNKKIATEIKILRQLLNNLSIVNNIPIENKDKVIFELHNSSYLESYDPRSGYILYDRNKFFADTIKNDFPDFFDQLYETIIKYREIVGLPCTEKNINYLIYILFTEWNNLISELYRQSKKVKVLIVSNRNLAQSYMLKNYLEAKFHTQLVAEVYDDTLISTYILENMEHDFIVANFPIPQLRNKDSIYIENLPNQNEHSQIQNKINRILSNKK